MEPVESVSEPLRHLDGRPMIWKMPGGLKNILEKAVPQTHELELFVSQLHTDPVLHEQPEMDVTAQWCFVHHTLSPHSKASLIKGKYGARYSVFGCYYGHNGERNPLAGWLKDGNFPANGDAPGKRLICEFSDNIVYNWKNNDDEAGTTTTDSHGLHLQFVANHYKRGEDTGGGYAAFTILGSVDSLYFRHNRMDGSLWVSDYQYVRNSGTGTPLSSSFTTHYKSLGNANTARDKVVAHGGCSRSRDVADAAYAAEVQSGAQGTKYRISGTVPAALISPYPTSGLLPGYTDSDNDGMDDRWEQRHLASGETHQKFLPWKDKDGDGWTNLEEYLNKTNPSVGDDPMAEVEPRVEGELFTP